MVTKVRKGRLNFLILRKNSVKSDYGTGSLVNTNMVPAFGGSNDQAL